MVVAIRSLPPSGVETLLSFAIASPPRDRMKSATCSAIVESLPNPDTSVPRSFTTTWAPRSARSSTYARPSPRPAPVTTATFPSNEIRLVISQSSFRQDSMLLRAQPPGVPCAYPDGDGDQILMTRRVAGAKASTRPRCRDDSLPLRRELALGDGGC